MMTQKPYIRVFEPVFTCDLANNVGRWDALRSYLHLTHELTDLHDREHPRPKQTAYYRYADNVAVLLERDKVYYCQTVVNGVADRLYEVLAETDDLRAFFDACGDNLTVLDNDRARMLKPDFDTVLTYVRCFADAHVICEKHDETMDEYASELHRLQDKFELLNSSEIKSEYKGCLYVAGQYMVVLRALSDELADQVISRARDCLWEDGQNVCRMFGLFVYALLNGINRGRHLHRHRRVLSHAFSEMLDELRQYLNIHPTIEEDYARFMHLPANERAKLHALLEDEGLFDKESGFIGGDLF